MTEEQGRQRRDAEQAGWHTGEPVEGEIHVHQMRKGGNSGGQSGEEAR